MLMEKVASLVELLLVDLCHELQMQSAVGHHLRHLFRVHLPEVHVVVPQAEGSRR